MKNRMDNVSEEFQMTATVFAAIPCAGLAHALILAMIKRLL
jgi:hypothetical protein